MKRSDFFIKLTTALLFIAVTSYVGISLYNSARNILVTAPAINYVIEETFPADGYIVRSETIMAELSESTLPIVGEGERVASGQVFAVEYLSREALETASEIRAIRLRIAQIEASEKNVSAETAAQMSVLDLSRAIHSGNLNNLDELSLRVETHVFTENTAPDADLPALWARLDYLERRSVDMRTISAPSSGFFSQSVDGFEHIEPDMIMELRPSELAELFKNPYGIYETGKLVTAFKWYYAAVMDAGDASRLSIGRQMTLQFSGAYHAALDMLVESIGRREDGMCVVLFSSDRGVHNLTMLRHLKAEVIFDAVAGIRVPKEAIHLDDNGTTFVYIQTGVRAERVNVEILLEFGDIYLVRDGLETGAPLRAGTTIIVKGNNLADGRIVA